MISDMKRVKGGQRKSVFGNQRRQLDIGTMTDVVNIKLNELSDAGFAFDDELSDLLVDRRNVARERRKFAAEILYAMSYMRPNAGDGGPVDNFVKACGELTRQPKQVIIVDGKQVRDERGTYYYLRTLSLTPIEIIAAYGVHTRLSTGRSDSDKTKRGLFVNAIQALPSGKTLEEAWREETSK
jgi:hypothetical protein